MTGALSPFKRGFAELCSIMERLKRWTDFRAAAAATRAPGGAFVLQARRRADDGDARVGFSVSRRVGNAVERNRVRRRLRELVRLVAAESLHAGHDYVLVGRRTALEAPFGQMVQELDAALGRIHARERDGAGSARKGPLHEAGSPGFARPKTRPQARPNQPMPER